MAGVLLQQVPELLSWTCAVGHGVRSIVGLAHHLQRSAPEQSFERSLMPATLLLNWKQAV